MTTAHRDRQLLYGVAFLRALTTSAVGVTLGAYLARLGLHGGSLGAVISCGLAGAALAAVVTTFAADRLGRKRFLVGLAALGAGGLALFAVRRAGDRAAVLRPVPADELRVCVRRPVGGAAPLQATAYPSWTGAVFLPRGSTINFKFIKKDGSNNVTWEAGGNRTFTVPSAPTSSVAGSWQ